MEKAPLPGKVGQHVLVKAKSVPNLQNTIQKARTEVNKQNINISNLSTSV
jgi:hypothetical protein